MAGLTEPTIADALEGVAARVYSLPSHGEVIQFGGVVPFTATTVNADTPGKNVRLPIKPR